MVILTMREETIIEVIQRVMDGRIDVGKASSVLDRTTRTIYRMLASVRLNGVSGIIHGNRGNKNAQKYDDGTISKITDLARDKYGGFNDTHMAEKLISDERLEITRESLRLMLRKAGIGPKRKRRKRMYRGRRERKDSFGMTIQIDASMHDWLEGRCNKMALVGGVDDAIGYVWADFEDAESTWAYLRLIRQISLDKGIPLSVYSDRHTIFHSPREATIVEQLDNKHPKTQFGRAMEELGIRCIKAWSPQAKGRIERTWGTFQDRLVAEMKLANICDKAEAKIFLKAFLKDFNKRFTCKPKNIEPAFRKRPNLEQLDRILCLKETRVVANDHTVQFEGLILQIPPSPKWASIAGQRVTVLQLRDGSIEIAYKQMIVAKFRYESVVKLINKCGFNEDHILLAA